MGSAFASFGDSIAKPVKTSGYIIAGILTLLGLGGICYPFIAPHPDLSVTPCIMIGGIFLCEGVITFIYAFLGSLQNLLTGMVLCSYIVGIASPTMVLSEIAEKKSLKELGTIIRERVGKEAVVSSFGLLQGFTFYAERRVVIVGFRGETEFGSNQGDQSAWFIDLPRFIRLWDSPTTVFTLLSKGDYKSLLGLVHTATRVVAQTSKYLLITNH
jgi:uncharacterized membrane protein HdeD (DUF308 family)